MALAVGAAAAGPASAAVPIAPRPAPAPPPTDRALELVSPVDKAGQPIDHVLQAADDDGESGGVLMQSLGAFGDVQNNNGPTFYRARRGATGWETVGMQPRPVETIPTSSHAPVFVAADGRLDTLIQETAYPYLPEAIRPGNGTNIYRVGAFGAFRWLSNALAPDGTLGRAEAVGVSRDARQVFLQIRSSSGNQARSYVHDGDRVVDVGIGSDGAALPDARPVGHVRAPGISDDGQTVAFTAGSALYVRHDALRPDATTSVVGRSERSGDPADTTCVNPDFFGMSADGRRILFRCSRPLTDDAPASGWGVYEYEYADGADAVRYRGPAPNARPIVLGGDRDLRRLYLYVSGSLALLDDGVFREIHPSAGTGGNPVVAVSRNGERLAFLSTTGIDGGYAGRQMYVYDATEGAEGTLTCVSCRPGAASGGTASFGTRDVNAPADVRNALTESFTADGSSFFFMSTAALTPEAPEGPGSVYEFHDGRVRLLAAGSEQSDARFAGVTSQGTDVFVITRQSLLPQDEDAPVPDLYSLRRGGGFPAPQPEAPPCGAGDCQGPGAPAPAPIVIGSLSFTGHGNLPLVPEPTRASVGVSKLKAVTGWAAKLKVRVPDAGRISVGGAQLRRASKPAPKGGTYAVKVALSAKAKKALKKRRKLKVNVRVSYKAKSGQSASKAITVTFKQPKAKRPKTKAKRAEAKAKRAEAEKGGR
ncbi:hypothetical protein [Conexibacter arvalis]|uniref:WD40-like Beta Propeller Repeat n=1 Tax=Conexibacter arvalis TaxID=912552 RepID=A0A840IBB5_9ACTN|nr:hypothetical protein [Conexibacter arvalis]MBB4662126.1 hypothetical protein [Conexibacter arvalis]